MNGTIGIGRHGGDFSARFRQQKTGTEPSLERAAAFSMPERRKTVGAMTYRQLTKAKARERPHKLTVMKSDDDSRLVFGWANVAVRVDGEQIVDWQEDAIDTEELEKAAYEYVADFGTAGEMHRRGGIGRVIESIVFTKEKADALGIPADALPQGWWIGFKIEDDEVWEKIKSGEYSMFSIEGKAIREPMKGDEG